MNHRRNYIHRLHVDDSGAWCEDQDILKSAAAQYFEKLLSAESTEVNDVIFNHIPSIISDEQNSTLCKIPDAEEVKAAVWGMNGHSAPGPDGFSGIFYTTCWDIISPNLIVAVQDFYRGVAFPRRVAASLIALIPKVSAPKSFSDYRPISLCNFCYKIVSRIMCNRIAPILPLIISEEQAAFVRGRQIIDNVVLSRQLVRDIGRKVRGHNVVFKLDMMKAYDRVEWDFLFKMLHQFGFSDRLISLIAMMINNCWFSVLINGSQAGFFKSSRGLRQGDPLAPMLFIIMEEAFSRGLRELFVSGYINFYKGPRGCLPISHLLYADDTLIFLNGDSRNIRRFLDFLRIYERASGQKVNVAKSSFLISIKAPLGCASRIKAITGFKRNRGSLSYLGVPIRQGRSNISDFKYIIDRINLIMAGWKSKLLSQAGRLVLINSVLTSIPMYLAGAVSLPISTIRSIEKICAIFFWSGMDGLHRRHWVSWRHIQRPKSEGGLGVRSIMHMQVAMASKVIWNSYFGNSIWSKYARSHFSLWKPCQLQQPFPGGIPVAIFSKAMDSIIMNGRWIMGNGVDIDILKDLWIGNTTIISLLPDSLNMDGASIQEVLMDCNHRLRTIPMIRNIVGQISLRDVPDSFIWRHTQDGNFSIKTAYHTIRSRGISNSHWRKIWHHSFNPRASLFFWKLFHQGVPTDDRIRMIGIPLVSRCSCCSSPVEEDIDHLFLHGDLAKYLWSKICCLLPRGVNISGNVQSWCSSILFASSTQSPVGFCFLYAALLSFWEIWRHRCAQRFDNPKKSAPKIWDDIRNAIHSALLRVSFTKPALGLQGDSLDSFGFKPIIKTKIAKLVRWIPPISGFALNVDGACKGNPGYSGGGGVIRDVQGNVKLAFAYPYGFGNSMIAEVRALCDGIRVAQKYSIHVSCIYSDSLALVNSISSGKCTSWQSQRWWCEAYSYLRLHRTKLIHNFREANQVANALASFACDLLVPKLFFDSLSLPRFCKGPVVLDKTGLPSIRLV